MPAIFSEKEEEEEEEARQQRAFIILGVFAAWGEREGETYTMRFIDHFKSTPYSEFMCSTCNRAPTFLVRRLSLRVILRACQVVMGVLESGRDSRRGVLLLGDGGASLPPTLYCALLMLTRHATSASAAIGAFRSLVDEAAKARRAAGARETGEEPVFASVSVAGRRYLEYLQGLQSAKGSGELSVASLPAGRPLELSNIVLHNLNEMRMPAGTDVYIAVVCGSELYIGMVLVCVSYVV